MKKRTRSNQLFTRGKIHICEEAAAMGTDWQGQDQSTTESTQNCWLRVPNGRTLGICSFSCGTKGSVNEVTNTSDNGAPDRVGLAPQVGHQQADVACHYMR